MSTPDRRPRRRVAVGPRRPQYLRDVESDRLMMIVTALTAEVSALRDRLDTHEVLSASGQQPTAAAIEAFVPDAACHARREADRMALLKRVYRVLTEELDAIVEEEAGQSPSWSMPDDWDKT